MEVPIVFNKQEDAVTQNKKIEIPKDIGAMDQKLEDIITRLADVETFFNEEEKKSEEERGSFSDDFAIQAALLRGMREYLVEREKNEDALPGANKDRLIKLKKIFERNGDIKEIYDLYLPEELRGQKAA